MLKRSIFVKRMLEDGKGEDILSFFHAKKNRPAKSDKSPKRVPDNIQKKREVPFLNKEQKKTIISKTNRMITETKTKFIRAWENAQ